MHKTWPLSCFMFLTQELSSSPNIDTHHHGCHSNPQYTNKIICSNTWLFIGIYLCCFLLWWAACTGTSCFVWCSREMSGIGKGYEHISHLSFQRSFGPFPSHKLHERVRISPHPCQLQICSSLWPLLICLLKLLIVLVYTYLMQICWICRFIG